MLGNENDTHLQTLLDVIDLRRTERGRHRQRTRAAPSAAGIGNAIGAWRPPNEGRSGEWVGVLWQRA